MGLNIVLEDERGNRIDNVVDPKDHLHQLLPDNEDRSSPCLRYVDWYGDTVFNRYQIDDVLQELDLLATRVESPDERQLVNRIVELAVRCKSTVGLYLKFYGD